MAWNWSRKNKGLLIKRKVVAIADGDNSKEATERAEKYIRLGHTRQAAYAKARKDLKEQYRKKDAKLFQAGTFSKK